jgi:hypothetical protein
MSVFSLLRLSVPLPVSPSSRASRLALHFSPHVHDLLLTPFSVLCLSVPARLRLAFLLTPPSSPSSRASPFISRPRLTPLFSPHVRVLAPTPLHSQHRWLPSSLPCIPRPSLLPPVPCLSSLVSRPCLASRLSPAPRTSLLAPRPRSPPTPLRSHSPSSRVPPHPSPLLRPLPLSNKFHLPTLGTTFTHSLSFSGDSAQRSWARFPRRAIHR